LIAYYSLARPAERRIHSRAVKALAAIDDDRAFAGVRHPAS
jgi:hypothetical protein